MSAEWGPSGRVASTVSNGASGTDWKLLVVMPFLMAVWPSRMTVRLSPCRTSSASGQAALPWETR